jgi:hypothetical protein
VSGLVIGLSVSAGIRLTAALAYFQPVIEELQAHPVQDGYLDYLRVKLRGIIDKASPAKVQNSTFSDDR